MINSKDVFAHLIFTKIPDLVSLLRKNIILIAQIMNTMTYNNTDVMFVMIYVKLALGILGIVLLVQIWQNLLRFANLIPAKEFANWLNVLAKQAHTTMSILACHVA